MAAAHVASWCGNEFVVDLNQLTGRAPGPPWSLGTRTALNDADGGDAPPAAPRVRSSEHCQHNFKPTRLEEIIRLYASEQATIAAPGA